MKLHCREGCALAPLDRMLHDLTWNFCCAAFICVQTEDVATDTMRDVKEPVGIGMIIVIVILLVTGNTRYSLRPSSTWWTDSGFRGRLGSPRSFQGHSSPHVNKIAKCCVENLVVYCEIVDVGFDRNTACLKPFWRK